MGLEVVEFVIDLENALGVSIPDHELGEIRTARELITYLRERVPPIDPDHGSAAFCTDPFGNGFCVLARKRK
jgi:hypothetical protein